MHHLNQYQQLFGLLLLKGGHGNFNVHDSLNVCCEHKGKEGTDKSVQVLTRKNWKMVFHVTTSGQTVAFVATLFEDMKPTKLNVDAAFLSVGKAEGWISFFLN